MARGKSVDAGSTMTKEELDAAEARLEGQTSPLPAPRAAKSVSVEAPDGFVRQRVGTFTKPAQVGDSGTLKAFKHIKTSRDGWIEMTFDEMADYEAKGLLVAYCSEEGLGLLKRR